MALMTVDQFRKFMPDVALEDEPLRIMLDANEAAIDDRVGPLAGQTEYLSSNGRQHIVPLEGPPSVISSVIEDGLTLDAGEYRVQDGYWLRRLDLTNPDTVDRTWGKRITVAYIPRQQAADRIVVLVDLMKCDLNHEPGMNAQSTGGWQESYSPDHLAERENILDRLRPRELFA